MLNFEKLILHNFGSYGHSEIELQNRGFCLVSGQNNYSKDNALSNGSGKSFLWNAVCFALVGETINGLKSNLKNINIIDDLTCYVTVQFVNNKDRYCITRHIAPKSDLKIIKNDIDLSGKGIRESEKKLAELLPDLTKNLITSTIIIGQGMPNKFSSFSPSGRKELLEKLTKADFMIEDIKQRVTTRLTTLTSQVREVEDAVLATTSQRRVFETNLRAAEQEFISLTKPDFRAQIEAKQLLITQFDTQITQLQQQREALLSEFTQLSEQLLKINSQRLEDLDGAKAAFDGGNRELLNLQASLHVEVRSLNQQISQLEQVRDTCPTCGQKLPGASKPDTSALREQLATTSKQLTEVTSKVDAYAAAHKQKIAEITEYYRVQSAEAQVTSEQRKRQVSQIGSEITALEQKRKVEQDQLTRLTYEQETWDTRYRELETKVNELTVTCSKLTEDCVRFEQHKDFLTAHLSMVRKMDNLIKRDFRGFLLANIITYLDRKAKEYCEVVFGTRDLEISLDGNDLNIIYCGKMFDNLSGGEKQRVDLILQFAIRNMLTAYLNFNSNILVLDEITDFLDKKSCKAVFDLITQELNTIESVFIVSHHASELALPIDSALTIEKDEFGISRVI